MSSTITTPNQVVTTTYAWLGAANASQSRRLSDGVTTVNESTNPNFALGVSGWGASSGTITYNSAEQRLAYVATSAVSATALFMSSTIAASGGQVKAAGVTVFNTSTTDLYLRLAIVSGSSFLYGDSVVIRPGMSGFLATNPAALPSNATGYNVYVMAGTGFVIPAGASFELDNVIAQTASTTLRPEDYFDGSTPYALGVETSKPLLVTSYESSRQSQNVFNPIVGGGMDVVLYPASLRTGTLVCLFDNEADAKFCEDIHSRTTVLTFSDSDHPTIGMTYVPSGSIARALDSASRLLWTVSIGFQEVQA